MKKQDSKTPPEIPDFTVYARKQWISYEPAGQEIEHFQDVRTDLSVSATVKARILQLLGNREFTIYDDPHPAPVYHSNHIWLDRACWYVHYTNTPERLGTGKVLIIDRQTAEVFYHGQDGGE